MTRSAVRLSHRLLVFLDHLAAQELSVAEIARRVGAEAARRDLPPPSYERVRQLVLEARRIGAARPSTAEVLVDVAFRSRPPEALLDHLAGVPVPRLEP